MSPWHRKFGCVRAVGCWCCARVLLADVLFWATFASFGLLTPWPVCTWCCSWPVIHAGLVLCKHHHLRKGFVISSQVLAVARTIIAPVCDEGNTFTLRGSRRNQLVTSTQLLIQRAPRLLAQDITPQIADHATPEHNAIFTQRRPACGAQHKRDTIDGCGYTFVYRMTHVCLSVTRVLQHTDTDNKP